VGRDDKTGLWVAGHAPREGKKEKRREGVPQEADRLGHQPRWGRPRNEAIIEPSLPRLSKEGGRKGGREEGREGGKDFFKNGLFSRVRKGQMYVGSEGGREGVGGQYHRRAANDRVQRGREGERREGGRERTSVGGVAKGRHLRHVLGIHVRAVL